MKRLLSILALTGLLIMLASGGSEAAAYRMKIASVGSEQHPSTPALHEFKKYVEEKSGGQIQVSLHINASLGGDRQATEAMQLGTLEAGIIGSSILATFEPKFNIFEFPFLFKDDATAKKLIDGEVGEMLGKELLKQDLRVIGYGVNGFRHITNNRNAVTKPADLRGIKIRTMENPIHIATFKAFGANPTPMNFGELYTALSQKTVDAQENPINLIYTSKFYEVQKYLSMTGHLYAVAPLVTSELFFGRLPKDLQKVVSDAGVVYRDMQRRLTIQEEEKMIADLKKSGMSINELSASEKAEFQKLAQPIYAQFESRVGKALLDKVAAANK